MSDRMISLSARALQQLLSGEITQAQFFAEHGWGEHGRANPFVLKSINGQLIAQATIKADGVADDSRVIFNFGNPDPAIAPFAVKAPSSTKPD